MTARHQMRLVVVFLVVCATGMFLPFAHGQSQTDQAPPPRPQRVRVSQGVAQGLLVKRVNPSYPPDAREARIQGVVLLHVIISKEGDVTSVELVSGHPALAPAAIEAVKQWKYKPFLLKGEPMEVDTQVSVNFTLRL